jgi:GAF domain-containing protein
VNALQGILDDLRASTAASRVTLRRDGPGDMVFPVVEESLAPGVGSLRGERTVHLPTQPVVLEVTAGRQVVQDDCRTAFTDPAFQRMLEVYGGLAAQIVTPVMVEGDVAAILSLHHLGSPRRWTAVEIAAADDTAERVAVLL